MGVDLVERCRVGVGGAPDGGGCRLTLRALGRVGDARTSAFDELDARAAGWDLGDGRAWDERCKAGDDMDAWRSDGVMKLVLPAFVASLRCETAQKFDRKRTKGNCLEHSLLHPCIPKGRQCLR